MNVVTIHQPEHLSYLGFFEKVSRCNTLVLLDTVNYEKNYFQNRNRIYTNSGLEYITVPVVAKVDIIKNTRIHESSWVSMRRKNIKKIELAYSKTPYFDKFYPDFKSVYTLQTESISELNFALLSFILKVLEIDIQVYFASKLNVEGAKSELLANICKALEADVYLAGTSGKDYLEKQYFDNLKIDFQNFKHPIYTQYGKIKFEPYMSVIDALFNVGKEIMQIIKAAQNAKPTSYKCD